MEGVYEALAHSAFAHRSYLAVDIRDFKGPDQEIPDERIVQECTRHGVGYVAFTDVADYNTYEIVSPAKLKEPDPEEVDNFIKKQISPQRQDELRGALLAVCATVPGTTVEARPFMAANSEAVAIKRASARQALKAATFPSRNAALKRRSSTASSTILPSARTPPCYAAI